MEDHGGRDGETGRDVLLRGKGLGGITERFKDSLHVGEDSTGSWTRAVLLKLRFQLSNLGITGCGMESTLLFKGTFYHVEGGVKAGWHVLLDGVTMNLKHNNI